MNENVKNLIKEISKKYNILVYFVDENKEKWGPEYLDLNSAWALGSDEIVLGNHEEDEYALIAFFHELAHCKLLPHDYCKNNNYNTFLAEIECWNLGIKEARKHGIMFSDEALKHAYSESLSYSGHDERECSGWEKIYKCNLIMEKLKNGTYTIK